MNEEKGSLSINSENLFPIIKKWLYSDKDIFIREIVSNAVDAIEKRRRLVNLGQAAQPEEEDRVDILINHEQKTITVSDNGIGMTAEEVRKYINQIAFSGAKEFLEKYKDAEEDPIIGHFGLGFYSAFMVSRLVEIETLSCSEGAEPVHWSCDGSSEYSMTAGTRQLAGTDIILHVNEEGEKYLDRYELQVIAEKYCSLMAVPIFLDTADDAKKRIKDKAEAEKLTDEEEKKKKLSEITEPSQINDTHPLYLKSPSECTDDEYKEFYRKVFSDYQEPLFWIHLNMDYPYNLKGILYFPRLNSDFRHVEGQVKLYCHQVYVADNVKEIIPEFLLLLRGVIDCPDIPLNVSRSYLQNDAQVRRISEYITKKVADKLTELFHSERENYEKYWADIHPFVKYGCLTDDKFYDKVKDVLLFRSVVSDKYVTLKEYLDQAKEKHENKVFYTDDARKQASYIQLLKAQEYDVIELDTTIDVPFMSLLESKNENLKFLRVDADLSEYLKENSEETISDEEQKKAQSAFQTLLGLDKLKVRLENMKDDNVTAMIELSEQGRRMQDMMKMYGQMASFSDQIAEESTLVVNRRSPLTTYVLEHPDSEDAKVLAQQIYDLARLSHEELSAEDMTAFLDRSQNLLRKLYS